MARLKQLYKENKQEMNTVIYRLCKLLDKEKEIKKQISMEIQELQQIENRRNNLHIPFEELEDTSN